MFDLSKPLFRIGVIGSILWLVIGIVTMSVFSAGWSALKPNEFGDVFAGLAAPMAFLWLVLGFLQQGHELALQVEELKNTVEQQRQLVDATNKQVAAVLRQEAAEREARREATLPRLVLAQVAMISGSLITYEISLTNYGATATNVTVTVEILNDMKDSSLPKSYPVLEAAGQRRFRISYGVQPKKSFRIDVSFTDVVGVRGKTSFIADVQKEGLTFIPLSSSTA